MADMAFRFWLYTNYLLTGMILQVGATAHDPLLSEVFSCLVEGKKVTRKVIPSFFAKFRKKYNIPVEVCVVLQMFGWKFHSHLSNIFELYLFCVPQTKKKKAP